MVKLDYHGQGRIISSREGKHKLVNGNTFLHGFNHHLCLDVSAFHISSLKPDLTFHDLSVTNLGGLSAPLFYRCAKWGAEKETRKLNPVRTLRERDPWARQLAKQYLEKRKGVYCNTSIVGK